VPLSETYFALWDSAEHEHKTWSEKHNSWHSSTYLSKKLNPHNFLKIKKNPHGQDQFWTPLFNKVKGGRELRIVARRRF